MGIPAWLECWVQGPLEMMVAAGYGEDDGWSEMMAAATEVLAMASASASEMMAAGYGEDDSRSEMMSAVTEMMAMAFAMVVCGCAAPEVVVRRAGTARGRRE
ncbi:coiled-coil domain-containing protein 129 [Striga asiatica]|uniref:Coiled-coil domain-containing protein 129 n=1 Tax=Striga asiatica TaxID=4170 RepID=A0A5A7PKH0_STRAF|nr:coiled-coil domain-containing protein 129 [Striga asiatica]